MKYNSKLIYSIAIIVVMLCMRLTVYASSHREAPLISNDPLADNVDVYAFRSPDRTDMITLIATYVPMQLPQGGPNYYSFGKNIRYEIHVDNNAAIVGDEITYRFTFNIVNEDPTTFFNIRLGKQNQKTTYNLERSIDGGKSFQIVIVNGIVPPNNIGPRSISGGAGLNTTYSALFQGGIRQASSGETVFVGPTDDPFFVDLGGIFDLGDAPRQGGKAIDGLACMNVSAIAIQVPIATLLKKGAQPTPENILDPNYVIGVWASASRPAITTLSATADPTYAGNWIQVSRLGMPLTNEAVIPIGSKDFWNSITPYEELSETTMDKYFYNPELALYMDDSLFGGAVPGFSKLRIQRKSLGSFNFNNGGDGLFPLKGNVALKGTALDDAVFGTLLLPGAGQPRSVDLWPIFHTGVPNVIPYQLATGKDGNPLAAGKPFINNFLPNGGDMLRLNMAVPVTPRNDPNFSSLGLVQAAAIGLTVAPFNTNKNLEFIPNMDGFPNGRRLEDDVTRIELQAVSGVVLAAVGLWYDDYIPGTSASPVTSGLLNVLNYTTGVEKNDRPFTATFPYLAMPNSGTGNCSGVIANPDLVIANPDYQLFVSSNTKDTVGIYSLADDNQFSFKAFKNGGTDADGIHYDDKNDVVYQLNRFRNVIYAYSKVKENLDKGEQPVLTATSTADFTNGREIAVSGNKLILVQDADVSNGNADKFFIYNVSPTSISLDKVYTVNLALWGIHLDGNRLYAVQDLSDKLLVFDNFFGLTAGVITPTQIITIENMVRTHGITYDRRGDIMVLTDVATASSDSDGALTIIKNFTTKASNNLISNSEQIIIEGSNTFLGNPVDVAFDYKSNRVYTAERLKDGGRVLGFDIPAASGNPAPVFNQVFPGASAIYLSNQRKVTIAKPDINPVDPNFTKDILVSTRMNGGNEVPAVTTNGIGVATIVFNSTYTQATINATVSNLSGNVTGAHIHKGAAGTNGSVLFNFTDRLKNGRLTATFDVTNADVASLINGEYYFNVHTMANPGGEVRGQLGLESAAAFMGMATSAQENPAVNSIGKALVSVIYTDNTSMIEINMQATDLSGPITAIHLHKGAIGVNGPVVLNLMPSLIGNSVKAKFMAPDLLADLKAGNIYLNIHTEAFPSGEIRAQLSEMKGLYFDTWLTGGQEVPAKLVDGIGLGLGAISSDLKTVSYAYITSQLTGNIANAHFHNGKLGTSGGVVLGLTSGINGKMGMGSGLAVDMAFVENFLQGNLYLNIHTAANAGGEVRGQVFRIARDAYVYDFCTQMQVPPVTNTPSTSGSGMFAFNRDFDEAHLMIVVNKLSSDFTSAHLHNGAMGTNGSVIFDITNRWSMNGAFFYTNTFTSAIAKVIQAGNSYANVHTKNNPSGEVRGQLGKQSNCPYIITATKEELEAGFEIYPNPTSDVVEITYTLPLDQNAKIFVYNLNGQTVIQQSIKSSKFTVNVAKLPAGTYVAQIVNGEKTLQSKIVKM